MGFYTLGHHIAHKLIGDFFKDFFCKETNVCTALLEVVEFNKLNDVSQTRLALGVAKDDIISIKRDHVGKVGMTNSNDDDAQRVLGTLYNQVLSFLHVVNLTICKDQEYVIHLKMHTGFHVVKDNLDDVREVGWST